MISKWTKMRPKEVQMGLKIGQGVFWSLKIAIRGFQNARMKFSYVFRREAGDWGTVPSKCMDRDRLLVAVLGNTGQQSLDRWLHRPSRSERPFVFTSCLHLLLILHFFSPKQSDNAIGCRNFSGNCYFLSFPRGRHALRVGVNATSLTASSAASTTGNVCWYLLSDLRSSLVDAAGWLIVKSNQLERNTRPQKYD